MFLNEYVREVAREANRRGKGYRPSAIPVVASLFALIAGVVAPVAWTGPLLFVLVSGCDYGFRATLSALWKFRRSLFCSSRNG